MTWKAFINEKMNCKKYETRWPETKPTYVGVAEEERTFPSLAIDESRHFYNYAMEEKCAYVFGLILRVARYNGRFFFSSEIYTGEAFCSSAIVIDKDEDLIQRLGAETPKHAYKKSPSIEAGRPKREIEDFALNFGMAEINKWAPYLKPHVENAVKKFSEAIAENG